MENIQELAEALKTEIFKRREDRLKSLAKISRQVCPRASSIGVCEREMVYSITHWDKKSPPDVQLMARFEEGKEQERKVIRELMDLGFEVIEGQKPFELRNKAGKVILTGTIDGKCLYKDKKISFEVKSLDPNIYSQLDSPDDFNKWDWSKRYPLQMQCYLYGNNEEEGLFIITDCKGHWKIFSVKLDYAQMEEILQKCERVMENIATETLPDFYKNASVCRKCWALGKVCTPPLDFGPGIEVVDDPEIEVKLARRGEISAYSKEFANLDKEIKDYFKGRPNSLCGNCVITGTERISNLKAQEAREMKSWITKIEKVEE